MSARKAAVAVAAVPAPKPKRAPPRGPAQQGATMDQATTTPPPKPADAGALQVVAPGAVQATPADSAGGALSLLNFVALAVKDPSIDVTKLEALLRMQREIVADDARALFNLAMNRVQAKLPRIKKNGVVEYPVNKNQPDGPKIKAFNYARWEDVDAGIRPLLHEEGFSLSFNTTPRTGEGGGLVVTGELLHIGGHSKSASMALPLDTSGGKSNLQGYASSTSFGSRYVAKMLLNIIVEDEDDDGVRGGKLYINDEMKQRISTLMRETKPDLEKFFKFARADSVDEIEMADYVRVVNMLEEKKRKLVQPGPDSAEASA